MSGTRDATFHVQLEPEWGWMTDSEGNKVLSGIKATRITQKRPDKPVPGAVMVKLTVRIPEAAFMPLRPEAVIVVPTDMVVTTTPIQVIAEALEEQS